MKLTVKHDGLLEVSRIISQLGEQGEFVASAALYDGAGMMADGISEEAKTIKTEPFHYAAVTGVTKRLPSPEEKAIVTNSGAMGIAKFNKSGDSVETSVGYTRSGYAHVNWNHMSSKARTNYKAQSFKNHDYMTTSTLKFSGVYKRGAQNAKPIAVIANSINSGTSFMEKQPFFRRGMYRTKNEAVEAIIKTAEKMFDRIIKRNETGGKTA